MHLIKIQFKKNIQNTICKKNLIPYRVLCGVASFDLKGVWRIVMGLLAIKAINTPQGFNVLDKNFNEFEHKIRILNKKI